MSQLVFLHVPKSAGVSLRLMLSRALGPDSLYPRHAVGDLASSSREDRGSYRLFFGHYDFDEVFSLPDAKVATILRDPIDRAVSLYRYWRSFGDETHEAQTDFGVQFARSTTIEEFFTKAPPGIRANYEDTATRQLLGASLCTPYTGFRISMSEAVMIAKNRLENMDACGVVEHFGSSVRAICNTLQISDPIDVLRANTLEERMSAPGGREVDRSPISPDLRKHLEDINVADRLVYEHAVRIAEARGTPE